jgi:hypothetical protein
MIGATFWFTKMPWKKRREKSNEENQGLIPLMKEGELLSHSSFG